MTDPWVVLDGVNSIDSDLTVRPAPENAIHIGFEDNFATTAEISQRRQLPDSLQYLQSLENKLNRLRSDSNILRQLAARREECISNLLNDDLFIDRDGELALDASLASGDSAVQEIYRHLRPVQPLNVGETVNIVDYDQLEEQRVQDETSSEGSVASR